MSLSTFILHYPPNIKRRQSIECSWIMDLDPVWITDYNQEDIADPTVYFDPTPLKDDTHHATHQIICMAHTVGLQRPEYNWNQLVRAMWLKFHQEKFRYTDPEDAFTDIPRRARIVASNLCKFKEAFRLAAESPHEVSLILEDDAIPTEDGLDRLQALVEEVTGHDFFIDVAGGCGLKPRDTDEPQHTPIGLSRMLNGQTRTGCGTLISRSTARAFTEMMSRPMPREFYAMDHAMSYMLMKNAIPTYWLEPTIFLHGSQIEGVSNKELTPAKAAETSAVMRPETTEQRVKPTVVHVAVQDHADRARPAR